MRTSSRGPRSSPTSLRSPDCATGSEPTSLPPTAPSTGLVSACWSSRTQPRGAALEALVHPPVREAIDAWFQRCRSATEATFAVADIPLLFETRRAGAFDRVVVVACKPALQLRRVMARDGLPAADVRRRIAAQLPIAEKVERADAVITTDGSFAETDRQVASLCRTLAAVAGS